VIERKEGKVKAPVACKACGHTPVVRIIEWVKCKKCDRLFGKTKTGNAWKMDRALHMVKRHGAKLNKELEKI
jgi:ribosomal protein L37AE/L43A